MPSASTSSRPFDRGEPVPGYKTQELLGRGGYGEVWRAIAPGGIAKAVKIIYGDADTSHADSELRSLARIKDVRHPLLLSIERIEVIEGNLIIITELADCSLKDQFQRMRTANLSGVPQDELLQYMTDAADALDFLYSRYALQHLDVKPENILLVSGRAKVGDFGLVKNLYERSVSLVGGLTPTYAPPELFEGRPTSHSDQYSLAIVYAQMLTGVLPFIANNTAQLAALHLRGVPDLSALPKRQRPIIARALSKDPLQRFATCTEMVAALKESVTTCDLSPAQEQPLHSGLGSELPTLRKDQYPNRAPSSIAADGAEETDNARDHRATSDDADDSAIEQPTEKGQPIVIVGVGGTGVEILARVVDRLNDRFGVPANWPRVKFLAVDSNSRELNSRFREQDLAHVSLVPIPLKSAGCFGAKAASFLKWLGRRWFYNIPRDLTTSGLRPLGRLALLTHAQRVQEAIAAVLSDAAAPIGDPRVAGGNETPIPHVILIGSICGGTGGGAILDLAYALRSELKRRGLTDDRVHGVLLHASPRSNADLDMARANAYATLSELHHFSRPGGHFPGEPLLGALPFHGDNATFGRTHLLDLRGSGERAEWELAADQVAEFIYGVSFSPARDILDEKPSHLNRQASEAASPIGARSYSVLSLGAGMAPAVSQAIRLACGDVIRLWQEGCIASPEPPISTQLARTQVITTFLPGKNPANGRRDDIAKQWVVERRLDLDSLLGDAADVTKLETGSDANTFIQSLIDECLKATDANVDQPDSVSARTSAIIALIDRFFRGDSQDGSKELNGNQFFLQLIGRMNVRVSDRLDAVLEWLRSLVDSADVRIEGARHRAVAIEQYLQSIHEAAINTAAALRETAITIGVATSSEVPPRPERSRFFGLGSTRKTPEDNQREVLKSYAEARLNELLYRLVARVLPIITAQLSTLVEQFDRLSRDLAQLAGPARETQPSWVSVEDELPQGAPATAVAFQQMLLSQLRLHRNDLARQIDEVIGRKLFHGGYGIRRFLEQETDLKRLLWRPLQEQSRQAVMDCIQEIKCQLIAACATGSAVDESAELGTLIAASFPSGSLTDRPHDMRQVLIVPDDADSSGLQEQLRLLAPELDVVRGRKCDITMCSIRRHGSLEQVADEIIVGNDIYKELAGRLHSRIDIAWQGFGDSLTFNGLTDFEHVSLNPAETAAIRG